MNDQHLSNFDLMHTISRVIFVVPVAIVLLAIYFQLQQKMTIANNSVKVTPTPTITNVVSIPSPTIQTKADKTIKSNLDLDGPYSCNYSDKEATAKAYIKNKNISLKITKATTQNLLLNGDCGYKWNLGSYTGEKMCGISTYLNLFSVFGGINLNTIFDMLLSQSSDPKSAPSKEFVQHVVDSCKKVEVSDTIFKVPQNIKFTEKQASASPDGTSALKY